MAQQRLEQTKELERLRQLLGEWIVGIAIKNAEGKVVSGCGEMSAVEIEGASINSEINTHIEGYEDYYENSLWSFDQAARQVHLYSITSEGEAHDHVGAWKDEATLELNWRGTFEDQDQQEQIIVKWISKNHIELKQTNYSKGQAALTTDYVFKRKEA